MVAAVQNLVYQQSTNTGASTLTLAAVGGRQTFDTAFNHGATTNVFYYFISNRDVTGEYEWGTGHMSDATTLVRDTVLGGSNGTSAVTLTAGTKDITCDFPASMQDVKAATAKATPANGDVFGFLDSAASYILKSMLWSDIKAILATLASPTFTGTPAAPTAAVDTNTTQLATTAMVLAQAAAATPLVEAGAGAVGSSTRFARGDHVHPAAAAATPQQPQGRLTLQTVVPVMSTTQSAKTTIYYTPYNGAYCPIYDGTNMVMTLFSELSIATTDTTKNPAAIGASKVNDWFVWNDSGTMRLSHGPDWTSDTARSAGTALVMVNGILLNNVSITNGPTASRGTYVGTTRSNASSQLDWIFGASAAGGTAALLNVWNAYNRVNIATTVNDSSSTAGSGTTRSYGNSTNNRASFVSGLAEDGLHATSQATIDISNGASSIGFGLDSTSAFSQQNGGNDGSIGITTLVPACCMGALGPQLGFHFIQLLESITIGSGAPTRGALTVNWRG